MELEQFLEHLTQALGLAYRNWYSVPKVIQLGWSKYSDSPSQSVSKLEEGKLDYASRSLHCAIVIRTNLIRLEFCFERIRNV